MRKLIAPVLAVAAAGSGAAAIAGCGADDAKQAVGLDPAKAAAATASKGSARIALDTRIAGAGLPVPIELKGSGVTSLTKPAGNFSLDLGPLLSLAGASSSASSKALDMRFAGGTVYVKPPQLDQLKVPGGRSWVSVRLPALAKALGLPTRGLGKLFTLDPAAQLRALKAAKGLKPVGKEVVGGANTTHYRGTYRTADLLRTLSPADRADVQAALKKLQALGGSQALDQAIPADLWVGDDGVTRKLQSTTKLPARGGESGGTISQTYVLSDFGTPLDVTPPAASDTYDATSTLTSVLGSLSARGRTARTP